MFAQPLDPAVRDAYLARLGVAPASPSEDALSELVRRHVERIPYETLWIQAGQGWGIDPAESARRIAFDRRGGYCYHLNGGLGLLLASLGYDVVAHVGGVHGPDGPTREAVGNHLALTVRLHGRIWYVDVGLGDAFHSPVRLAPGQVAQPPWRLEIERVDDSHWHLVHDHRGGFRGMVWSTDPAAQHDFAEQHRKLSTDPGSGFVQVPMAEVRDATEVVVVRGRVLSRIGEARTDAVIATREEWFGVLADLFDLRLTELTGEQRDRLWASAEEAHRRWEAEQLSR